MRSFSLFAAFTLAAAADGAADWDLFDIVFGPIDVLAVATIGVVDVIFGTVDEVIVEFVFDVLLATTIVDGADAELELMIGLICVEPTLIGTCAEMVAPVGTFPIAVCLIVAGAACLTVTDLPIVAPEARICESKNDFTSSRVRFHFM